MNDTTSRILTKISSSFKMKNIGQIRGLEFVQVNVNELRKAPYVYAVHDDRHPVRVSERWVGNGFMYNFAGVMMTLPEAYAKANPSRLVLTGEIPWPRVDADKPRKAVVSRVPFDTQKAEIKKFLKSISDGFTAQATYSEISKGTKLSESQVKDRIKEMLASGDLIGSLVPGKGGIYIVR